MKIYLEIRVNYYSWKVKNLPRLYFLENCNTIEMTNNYLSSQLSERKMDWFNTKTKLNMLCAVTKVILVLWIIDMRQYLFLY